MHILFGDGIHDDTDAIQEMIDSGCCEVFLPAPKVRYVISRPLELPSNFKLCLPRFAEIRLAKGSNCVMLKNKMVVDRCNRTEMLMFDHAKREANEAKIYDYIDEYSPDAPCVNIEVTGGIWNFNNLEQGPSPILTGIIEPRSYSGFVFLFYNVRNLRLANLTLKDPSTFSVTLDKVSYFTVENITFDFNYGNPLAACMDGIHLVGNCHFGFIHNLKGACYDDLVAINADEGSVGPITNIRVSGIYAEDCHSAVRFLSCKSRIENVHISDIYGTYFQYCVGISKYYKEGKFDGYYDAITIDHVYASKAVRKAVYNKTEKSYVFPIIWVEGGLEIHDLKITDVYRREKITPVETIKISKGARIDTLILDNLSSENQTEAYEIAMLVNEGEVKNLYPGNIRADGRRVNLD